MVKFEDWGKLFGIYPAISPLCHFATLRIFALEIAPVRQSSLHSKAAEPSASMTLLSLNRNLKEVANVERMARY